MPPGSSLGEQAGFEETELQREEGPRRWERDLPSQGPEGERLKGVSESAREEHSVPEGGRVFPTPACWY